MRTVFIPLCFCFDHCVERGDHFSHGGDECDLVFFAVCPESFEKFLERRVESNGTEGCHVQRRSDVGTAAFDVPLAGFGGTVATKGRDSDEGGDLLAVQFAEFRQGGKEHLACFRPDAWDGLQNFVLFAPIGVVVDHFCDTIINVGDLFVKGIDDFFDAFGNDFLVRLLQPVFFLGSHPDELLPSRDEIAHLLCFAGRDGSRREAFELCEPCEHFRIDGIGLGELSETFGEVAGLPRVDAYDDKFIGGEVCHEKTPSLLIRVLPRRLFGFETK